MSLTYDWSLDLDDANNTTTLQYHAVPHGSLVLDIGCATGFLGLALGRDKGCRVVGVELDRAQADAARERGLDVMTGDVTSATDRRQILERAGRRFDAVILGDVLEHLTDPFGVLRAVVDELLDPAGTVVTSIPNVAHGSLRLDLLRGRFQYTGTGLLDRTHVQLFTHDRIVELFEAAGLEIVADQRSFFPIVGTEGRVADGDFADDLVELVGSDPTSWVYQYVTTARPQPREGDHSTAVGARPLRVVVVGAADTLCLEDLSNQLPGTVDVREVVATHRLVDVLGTVEAWPVDEPVLVVDTDVQPAPAWTGPLLEAHREREVAVGAITVDSSGAVVAAGLTEDGRPRGAGERVDWGLVDADADGVRLSWPCVATAGQLVASGGVPVGRVVRRAVARTRRPSGVPVAATPRDLVGDGGVTLVVGREGPHRLPPSLRSALVEAAGGSGTVAYRWEVTDLRDVPDHAAHLADSGLVRIGVRPGDPGPSTAGAARALDAGRVVWLDPQLAAEEMFEVGTTQPAARRIVAASRPVPGCDEVVEPSTLAAVHLAPVVARRPTVVPPPVAPVEVVAGRTSVIVVMHGLPEMTARCLDAVRATTEGADVELVLVDNGSAEGELEQAVDGHVDVNVVEMGENTGFARGANAGVDAATGQYVCILNNDTEPLEEWLDEMHRALASEGVVMVGTRSDEISGLQRLGDGPRLADAPEAARATWGAHAAERRGEVFPLGRLVAVCLLVERATLEEHGGFAVAETLGNFEDDELSTRLAAAGGRLVVADGAVVLHHGSATFRSARVDYVDQMLRAARSLDVRRRPVGMTALVLSDGVPASAAVSAVSATAVCDRVMVRSPIRVAELAVALGGNPRIEVHAEARSKDGRVLVLAAGERVVADDPWATRAWLWSADGDAGVRVGSSSQLRWLPADALDRLARVESASAPGMTIAVS